MIFVDTGPLLARYLERDQHHEEAREGWRVLERVTRRIATSSFVLDELLTLLARRASYTFAAERGRHLYRSRVLEVLRPRASDELRALDHFARFADQRVSFTNCVSFALMERERLRFAFTFDHHFRAGGFEIWTPEAGPPR